MCELHIVFKTGKNNNITEFEKNCLFKIMESSSKRNDDGHGIYSKNIWYRNHKKFEDDKKLKSKINESIGHLILAHSRLASNGEICEENTHPFNLNHIVFLHNGIIRKYEDKEINDKMNDSLFIAKKLNEEFGRTKSEKKTIKNVLSKIEGSISAFIYFKKSGNLYYYKNANGFTFALTDGNCIIGSSNFDNIEKSISYNFLGFRIPYIKILAKLKPENDKLYQITEKGIKELEEIEVKTYSYSYSQQTIRSWDNQKIDDDTENGGVEQSENENAFCDTHFQGVDEKVCNKMKFHSWGRKKQ